MIYLIGNAPDSPRYQQRSWKDFCTWFRQTNAYQLDIETNVTPWWCDKKMITLQLGDLEGVDQWVIQWSILGLAEQRQMRLMLEDHSKLKVIHNAMFECVVLLFHGIRITNVYD